MNGDTFKQLFCIELIQYKTISIQNNMIKSNSIQNKMIEIKFDTKIIYTHALLLLFFVVGFGFCAASHDHAFAGLLLDHKINNQS